MTTTQSPLEIMRARTAGWQTELAELDDRARELRADTRGADRKPTASEARMLGKLDDRRTELREQVRQGEERVDELEEARRAELAANETRKIAGDVGEQRATVTESSTYHPGRGGPSFMSDLVSARRGDWDAAQRLARNQAEQRALGNTGATGGSGGDFAVPAYLLDQFVALARPGRVFADRWTKQDLPANVSSIVIPKIATGTTTAIQSTQNTSVSNTDLTTTSLDSGIVTVAGKQVVSQQLIDQSGVPIDEIVLGDLAADYAAQIDVQTLTGSGTSGQLLGALTYFTASGTANVTYTQSTPAVAGAGGFYSTVNKAISAVSTARFLPPTAILMHPRRWSWVAAAFDGNNRPLVSPSGGAYNQVANAGDVAAQGMVGQMAGLPVFVDPSIPINLGGSTNQDVVIVGRFEDLFLWESPVVSATFDAPYADSMGVLFRVHGYSSAQPARYPSSVALITGTGLVTPAY